ncbi:MAG TPA: LLM class flavin-dependent oxidoreductase [Pseudonocardia sp.]
MAGKRAGQMAMVAFMQASNVSVFAGSWRWPSTEHTYLDMGYYQKIARTLEEGTFDLMFFDDRLAMPAIYGDSVGEAVRHGARPIKLDLSIVLGAAAAATQRLGLGATYSTTYYPPYHVARTFATLDHLSAGRAAWNVVTSVNDAEARNFGMDAHLEHDTRYDRAEEFLDVVFKLWDSWEDDAIIADRAAGLFADPDKVHELHHRGEYFSVRGPLTVPRTPQGRPPIIQAGSSGRGRDFAARWADLIFTAPPTKAAAQEHYRDQKDRIIAMGRDPDLVRVLPMAYAVVGETEAQAREKEQILHELVHPMASLTLLSELTNYDFSEHGLDEEVTDELLGSVSGIRGMAMSLRRAMGDEPLTLRTLAAHRATLLQGPRFVGTGEQVAEQMHEWFDDEACDGFVLGATHLPGTFEEFVRMVVPQLRNRGVFREAYSGPTLRDHLGLPRPERVPGARE